MKKAKMAALAKSGNRPMAMFCVFWPNERFWMGVPVDFFGRLWVPYNLVVEPHPGDARLPRSEK
jgi:hypothetical protein